MGFRQLNGSHHRCCVLLFLIQFKSKRYLQMLLYTCSIYIRSILSGYKCFPYVLYIFFYYTLHHHTHTVHISYPSCRVKLRKIIRVFLPRAVSYFNVVIIVENLHIHISIKESLQIHSVISHKTISYDILIYRSNGVLPKYLLAELTLRLLKIEYDVLSDVHLT